MADGQGPTRDGAQGTLSRLLVEIFQAPEVDLAASWREPLEPGDVVGRYQIKAEIGRGGFGAVYEAFDPELGRTVALKALKPGRTRKTFSEEWIKKEAEAVAKLDHPAIVTIFDVGTCPAGAYLVMELLRGETLAKRIEKGPLPVDEALRIAEQMAEGLSHAHSRGVLHRDLKPANVFVCEDGRVKLLDFGLAHLLGTEGSSGAGTPAYMAPEQAAGAVVDERADVWAAGMVLGEMLTGKRPVERTPSQAPGEAAPAEPTTELMWEAPKDAPQPPAATPGPKLAGVPRPVARVMGAALSEDPGARPRDGKAWLSELRSARLLIDRPRRLRRITAFATAFILVGLTVAGLATWRIWERQIPGGRPTVAVADFTNETGEKELDSISGLLITSLEQGTQLRVLTRGRMVDVLKQLGKGAVERIDETLAREVGRETRAQALLLASIRKLGDAYVVEMRALDPLHDEYIFTVSDRATGKGAVFDLVDRLGDATRKRLGAPDRAGAPPPRVASITTDNPKAWALLFQSRQALDRMDAAEARRLAQEAVKEDPEFALAYHHLAWAAYWAESKPDHTGAPGLKEMEAAEARANRLPEKERLTLRMFRALVDRRLSDASRLAAEAVAAYPLDKDVLFQAGDIFYHWWVNLGASVEYFERALKLDPTSFSTADHLLDVIWLTGQTARFVPFIEQRAAVAVQYDENQLVGTPAAPKKAAELQTVAVALLAAGKEREGGDLLDRAARLAGIPGFRGLLWCQYLCYQGRMAEAEAEVRAAFAMIEHPEANPRLKGRKPPRFALYHVLLASGRVRDALAVWEGRTAKPARPAFGDVHAALTKGSADELEPALARWASGGEVTSCEADLGAGTFLAVVGDRARARQRILAARSSPDWNTSLPEMDRRVGDAILAWSDGRMEEADSILAENIRDASVADRYNGRLLAGTFHFTSGDCPEAVSHLEEARAVPWPSAPQVRSYNLPLLLHRLSICYEKMGDLPKARQRNDEMLKRWERADPDIPLLVEAKELQARLGGASAGR